tara:strand:+ start:249 stop:800 length:552 start_codon:yes stop_codon:yes gene_type:complete
MAKTKVLERKPLTFAEKTFLPQITSGLATTFVNMFKKSITMEYPEVRPVIPDKYRGIPTLVKDPKGRVKCVSCQLCEFVCPPKAIRIKPSEIDPDTNEDRSHIEKEPKDFDINMLRCIYCGLCEEVCPEEAIFLQDNFSLSGYTRESMVYGKEKLLELGGTLPDKHFKWDKKKEAEENNPIHH